MTLDDLFRLKPYSLTSTEKAGIFVSYLNELTQRHVTHCKPYRSILAALNLLDHKFSSIAEFPFLPVRLFKDYELQSVSSTEVLKTLNSSGTTSARTSRVFVDKTTSLYQIRALSAIVQDFLGTKRLPMIIVDSEAAIASRNALNARAAAIRGFSNFGKDHLYILDEQMSLKGNALREFMQKHLNETILIFGFTSIVWQHFLLPQSTLQNAALIHGGGWKKMESSGVGRAEFKAKFREVLGIERIHNYYGLVEQAGSIFMECENGFLHSSNFSDILVRDPIDWSVLKPGLEGVLETISLLPHSYPGHCLLTDDMGRQIGEDDCRCGRKGKYFEVIGRIPQAELRGCSDTYSYAGFSL